MTDLDMDRCVCCGRYVPEGSMVCSYCINNGTERTVELKPVVHGYWKLNEYRKRKEPKLLCSNCDYGSDIAHRYCPNCGATMDADGFSVVYVIPKIPPKRGFARKNLTYEE